MHTVASPLDGDKTYSWRVRVTNPCGSDTSSAWTFLVAAPTLFCQTSNLSIPDGLGLPVEDLMEITQTGPIDDLMLRLVVTHDYVGDLGVELTHVETGTVANLIDQPGVPLLGLYGCSEADMDLTLSDDASSPAEDECESTAPAIAGTLSPTEPLSKFDGEGLDGFWKISVSDYAAGDSGQLVSWCLEPTYVPEPGSGIMLLTGIFWMLAERKLRRRQTL